MSIDEKVLNRIRKLMATAQGTAEGGEHERDTAMRMALNLLAKHNLSMSDLEEAQEQRIDGTDQYHSTPWMKTVAQAIAHMYFCKMYYTSIYGKNRVTYHFIGLESNVATTREMVRYVITAIERDSRRAEADNKHIPHFGHDFRRGAAARIYQRCADLRRQAEQESEVAAKGAPGTAIVLASLYKTEMDKNDAWLAAAGVMLGQAKSRKWASGREAYGAGSEYGNKVSLNRQVGVAKNDALRIK